MGSLSVIEDFDVIEDFASGLILIDKTAVVGQLVLQAGEKALYNSVVSRMPLAAHGGGDAQSLQAVAIVLGRVLAALIRVVHQARSGAALLYRHVQRRMGQALGDPLCYGPTDHPPGMQIHHDGQIEPTRTGRHIGNVTGPDPVGPCNREALLQEVRCRRQAQVMRHRVAEPTLAPCLDAVLTAQAGDPVLAAGDPSVPQNLPGLERTVGPPALPVQIPDMPQEAPIIQSPPAHLSGERPAPPTVVAAA